MNIVISGGTGLVGRHLIPLLLLKGHSIVNLTTRRTLRGLDASGVDHSFWDPASGYIESEKIANADVVINLSGFPVSKRWTEAHKNLMLQSRIQSSRLLSETILHCASAPGLYIGASATGFYGSSEAMQDESAANGSGFLSGLTAQWEKASAPLENHVERRIILRTGVILAADEGALSRMIPLFKAGLGAPVGSGTQWISWIHIHDVVRSIDHLVHHQEANGVYNIVSPDPRTNKSFSRALAKALHRPFFLPSVPSWALKLVYGEMSTMVLSSHKISCRRLVQSGFSFNHPLLEDALTDLSL